MGADDMGADDMGADAMGADAMGADAMGADDLWHTAVGAWKLALVERPCVHTFGSVPMFASEHHPTGSRAPSRRKTSLAGPLLPMPAGTSQAKVKTAGPACRASDEPHQPR